MLGFGFRREQRAALIASEPEKFFWPIPSDMRYQWVRAHIAALDCQELHELVANAWRMTVPKKVWQEYLDRQ